MRSLFNKSSVMLIAGTWIILGSIYYSNAENNRKTAKSNAGKPDIEIENENPLLMEWTGPYGGLPPFDKVKVSDFKSALEIGMRENLMEIQAIADNKEPANFENTIAAMERSGRALKRVQSIYGVWSSAMNLSDFQVVQEEMEPKLAEFTDKISQNEKLFKRVEFVFNSPDKKNLSAEQQRLVWNYYNNFVLAGAKLDAKTKVRLSEINQKLAGLFTSFSQNLRADENDKILVLKTQDDLAGLPQSIKDAAAEAAKGKQMPGLWVIKNTRSSIEPFLTYSTRRDLREIVWRMYVNRGDNNDKNDNKEIITEILQLRAERAKLLGFPTHAHWRVNNSMAKTPDRAMELLMSVWKPAVERVHEEVEDMQALSNKENANITIEPWDYRFYAEKVRKARYDLDQNEVKQYLQLDKLREGMFYVAGELFNFSFTPLQNIPVYRPDIQVWEVKDKTTGKHVGLWYFDAYAREGKNSGAWMNEYRTQEKMDKNISVIVSNNANFVSGKPGEPVLISWEDATTLFHEFGHALHGLSSNVTYPSLAGTNVVRDYVEFPSQVLERWLSTPEVLLHYAINYQTGKPIPQTLVDKIKSASTFNRGFKTVENLASALVDMKLHLAGSIKINPDSFERAALAELGMPKEIVMRHRPTQFAHIFSGDEYSAGYYSYTWSDVLSSDAYSAFTEAGGPYDKEVAARLRKYVFTVGNTIDPEIGYREFRGRNPKTDALMIERGFNIKNNQPGTPNMDTPKPKSSNYRK